MELTKKDRLILINQFLILEKLYPDEADYYEKHRIALQQGYKLHYPWIVENLWEELDESECRRVLDTLDMYRAVKHSYERLKDKSGIEEHQVEFPGYDGNNESHHLSYARYFIVDLDRYDELRKDVEYPDFNSHCQMLDKYDRMLARWAKFGKSHDLAAENIKHLLEA